MQSVQTDDIARLDGLLDELGKETEAPCEALREHFESARVYLAGLMPAEFGDGRRSIELRFRPQSPETHRGSRATRAALKREDRR